VADGGPVALGRSPGRLLWKRGCFDWIERCLPVLGRRFRALQLPLALFLLLPLLVQLLLALLISIIPLGQDRLRIRAEGPSNSES
jgi:hypothetical protein